MANNKNKQFAKSNIPQGTPQSMTNDTEFSEELNANNANANNEKQSLSKQSNKKHKN